MSDQPVNSTSGGSTTPAATQAETPAVESKGPAVSKIIIGVIAALVGTIVLGFLIALLLAFTNPGAAEGMQIIRDFFIILMSLEGILIGAALIILVLQMARLINLLQNEVKPILEQTNDTVKTVRGTASFVSRNVTEPVIQASGFVTWLFAVVRELFGIRGAVRGGRTRTGEDE